MLVAIAFAALLIWSLRSIWQSVSEENRVTARYQELALAAVESLRGVENVMLVSLATDGEDGPTDAAGAIATGESGGRAESLAMTSAAFLSANDAYSFFAALGDLVQPGPSGTNVNDLVLVFAF